MHHSWPVYSKDSLVFTSLVWNLAVLKKLLKMERSNYFKTLSGDVKLRYEDKIKIIDGIDPYTIKPMDFGNLNLLPDVNMIDLVNYLILTHSFYTGQQLKAFKSLKAYKFYESGFVQNVSAKQIKPDVHVIVGKVKHSQRLNEKPLEVWIIIANDGSIASAHCTCMAGLGEVCSHVAAILFYLNAKPSVEDEACTSKLAAWPVPPLKQAKMCRLKDMDWARSTKTKAPTGVPAMSDEEMGAFLQKLHDAGVTSAAARLMEPVASTLTLPTDENLPPSLDCIFTPEHVGKSYDALMEIANNTTIQMTQADINHVEESTRDQSLSTVWLNQRTGRITASIFKAVCRTTLEKPSLSVVKGICYPQKMLFSSKQTTYGLKHKIDALNEYKAHKSMLHQNFSVKRPGFYISDRFNELGASPDGIFSCDCCLPGCVEVKCPFLLKEITLIEYAKRKTTCLNLLGDKICLDRNHSYYYQIQLQMFVTKTLNCHFVIWSPNTLFVEKIALDEAFIKGNVVKAIKFFKYVIKPELLGKYFTQRANADILFWCICQKANYDKKMIKCDNEDCNIGWFHFECVGLNHVPDTYWICSSCSL